MNDATSNINIVITLDNMLFPRFRAFLQHVNNSIKPLLQHLRSGPIQENKIPRCLILLKKHEKLLNIYKPNPPKSHEVMEKT